MSESLLKADGVFQWYEPGEASDAENKVAGRLEIAETGLATLSLVGLLPDHGKEEFFFSTERIDQTRWIFGVLKDGRYVFLRSIDRGASTFGTFSHQEFIARECVLFQRLKEYPELDSVTKLQINLDFLGNWASPPLVQFTRTPRGAASRATKPKVRTFKLPGKTLQIRTDVRSMAPSGLSHSATIKQETTLESQPKARQTLMEARADFHRLEDILLMLADVDVELPWPTVRYQSEYGTYFFERRRTNPQKVEIVKSWAALAWSDIKFGQLVANLEAQQEILGPGLYLYLGIRRGAGLYLENKFSTAIFGLESLHRRVGKNGSQTKLEDKIERILEDVKRPKDREWLSARLRNAGEPSLAERLFHTFSELDIGLDLKALRSFAQECADVRNQVAHFGGQRGGGYDEFVQKMFFLNEAVRPLYHAVLLRRIGFDHERIRKYFHSSPDSEARKRTMKRAGLKFVGPDAVETADGLVDHADFRL